MQQQCLLCFTVIMGLLGEAAQQCVCSQLKTRQWGTFVLLQAWQQVSGVCGKHKRCASTCEHQQHMLLLYNPQACASHVL